MTVPTREDILGILRETDPARLEPLWAQADATRRAHVGDEVHLRGLVEISSRCARACAYCGLRAPNAGLERYRLTADEIRASAREARDFGFGTVVLQAGEDDGLTGPWVADVVRAIKAETGLAITLSLGERSDEDLVAWREAGADRYLLRFETSDPGLYRRIHPPRAGRAPLDRIALLRRLRAMGYEIGSGVMVGIPGQTWETLADDLECFRALDLDMIGIGPFIPHPDTPLGQEQGRRERERAGPDQVPGDELTVYKMVALTRLLCPQANLPSTTALATINKASGRELGLMRGGNVVMPNLTPVRYRRLYQIYPAKACVDEPGSACHACLGGRIRRIGRRPGQGPGGRSRGPGRPDAASPQGRT